MPTLDRAQFLAVYEESAATLRRYVMKLTGSRDLVEDIAQESYLRLLTVAPAHLTRRQLQTYLFSTATNIVRDSWRRGTVTGHWKPLDEEALDTGMDSENVLSKIDSERILSKLSILQRSIVWLAYAEGYSHREIAQVTGVKEKSVRVLLFRARQKIKRELHDSPLLSPL
jgi:RNA polymerase sigma-70 factor (ECF subfamily)